ncbi:GNAT family N-acetyltransferase [Enterocloster citroniae]|uniref:GNAT family N-acetyltransferase n=1 Tax=Enterocloster citroniae TaxID=358743 RepID=UPI0032C19A62
MIRLFEFRDLDKIMEVWLEGNLQAHAFIGEEHWKQNYESVKSVLPNAEVYVYEEAGEIRGFIGMDADYIAGLFIKEEYRGRGIGHRLIETVKRKKRLSLHVYERNTGAVAFYRAEGFKVQQSMTEKETGEREFLMVYGESE